MIQLYENKKKCYGCTACFCACNFDAIKMDSDGMGFLYPTIDADKCVECGACVRVCPQKNVTENPEHIAYAIKHKDDNVRLNSTSGGAFTLLSDYILENDGVVFGAAFDDNYNVIHTAAMDKEHRNKQRISKYVQSELNDVFFDVKSYLEANRQVLFVGTPCQVAGIKMYLGKDYNNLYLIDLICHGVAAPKIWKSYIKHISKKYGDIKNYLFRDPSISWDGINTSIVLKNNRTVTNSRQLNIFNILYWNNFITRPSCEECKYASKKRVGDITLGDFWGVEKHYPSFRDYKGVSMVLINSNKGEHLFELVKDNCDYIKLYKGEYDQPHLKEPVKRNPECMELEKDYIKYGFMYVVKRYCGYGLKSKIASILRILGILKFVKPQKSKEKI